MFEILIVVLFIWLAIKAIGLSLRVAWGAAKIVGSLLFVLALPALVLCLIFASGAVLLVPVVLLGVACVVLKSC